MPATGRRLNDADSNESETAMSDPNAITLVQHAIHNPDEPRHFMRVVPAGRRITATIDDVVIADSAAAVVVKEVGRDIYDPVVYFPREDVRMDALAPIDKTTYCPLKGSTEYFDVDADGEPLAEAAWSYVEMRLGDELKDLIAFDPRHVRVGPVD